MATVINLLFASRKYSEDWTNHIEFSALSASGFPWALSLTSQPPPHGFRCWRSLTILVAPPPVAPNFTSDFLVAPPQRLAGGDSISLPTLLQADGDTRPLFLAFGLYRYSLFVARLVRDLDQHTHPSASMAQHNRFTEWSRRSTP